MNRFEYYKQIKKNAVRVLLTTGLTARQSMEMLRQEMPYLFKGKSFWDGVDADYTLNPLLP